MKELLKKYSKKTIIVLIIAITISLTYMLVNIKHKSFANLYFYVNALSISGMSIILVGGISLCNNLGAFEFFSYAFSNRGSGKNAISFPEYVENRKINLQKKKFLYFPYFFIGGIFTALGMILYFFI